MSFYQSGPNASAYIGTFNDVGRDQNNINGNEVFQVFDLYIMVNTYSKIIAGNNNTFNNLGPNENHEALIGRKSQFYLKYTKIYWLSTFK